MTTDHDAIPDNPPGIDPQTQDLPAYADAAERVLAFVSWFGDGRVLVYADDPAPPLYARDLEALARPSRARRPVALPEADLETLAARLFLADRTNGTLGPWISLPEGIRRPYLAQAQAAADYYRPCLADHDTAAVLTEAERYARDVLYRGSDSWPTLASSFRASLIVEAQDHLAAQPPQDDPQPDEREALTDEVYEALAVIDPEFAYAIGSQVAETAAALLFAAGFRRDPDAGLREWGVFRNDNGQQVGIGTTEDRQSAVSDAVAWEADGYPVTIRARVVGPWRAALAEPTPGSPS